MLFNSEFFFVSILFPFGTSETLKGSTHGARRNSEGKILGGTDAQYGEFPHQVMILRGGIGGSYMCSGSLLSSLVVVTAGHCCDG